MKADKNLANWLTTISPRLSNRIVNFLTKGVSISQWDNRLLGLSSFPIETIIDIGANEGQSCRKLKSIFPDASIYAFEPSQLAYAKLKILAERYQNLYSFNLALGKENSQVTFYEHSYFSQSSSLLRTTQECEENYPFLTNQKKILIEQTTLDNFFETKKLESEILIKMDVQGAEDRVIKGGKQVLNKAMACIIEASIDTAYEKQASFETIFDQLRNLEYKFIGTIDQVSSPTGAVQYFDAVFVKERVLSTY